jgi:hypothetical protein
MSTKVSEHAASYGTPINTHLEPRNVFPPEFYRDMNAFHEMFEGLLAKYEGQYVVIHNEKIVSSGPDRTEAILAAYKLLGYVSVYAGHVSRKREPVSRSGVIREVRE